MRHWLVLGTAALLLILADQATKYMAVRDLTGLFDRASAESIAERISLFYGEAGIEHLREEPVHVLPFWRHAYTENEGAAFGLFAGRGRTFRLLFFGGVTLLAVVFVLVMGHRAGPGRPLSHLALGAVLGGVLSNFLGRATRGYVIDFIDLHLGDPPRVDLPSFNLADAGITLGVLLLLAMTVKEALRHDS